MSEEAELACPVCRARQTPQPFCRRCNADLQLYVKALQSRVRAESLYEKSFQNGNFDVQERTQAYLQWLRPRLK